MHEKYKVTNQTNDSIFVKWSNINSGSESDSAWIQSDEFKILAIIDGEGDIPFDNMLYKDVAIESIKKDFVESLIDYSKPDSWNITKNKKETVYELILSNSDF